MAKMQLAAKFGRPVIALIDTPGAYPGVEAEERGQSQVIAESMFEMSQTADAHHLRCDRRRGARAERSGLGWAIAWPCCSKHTIR